MLLYGLFDPDGRPRLARCRRSISPLIAPLALAPKASTMSLKVSALSSRTVAERTACAVVRSVDSAAGTLYLSAALVGVPQRLRASTSRSLVIRSSADGPSVIGACRTVSSSSTSQWRQTHDRRVSSRPSTSPPESAPQGLSAVIRTAADRLPDEVHFAGVASGAAGTGLQIRQSDIGDESRRVQHPISPSAIHPPPGSLAAKSPPCRSDAGSGQGSSSQGLIGGGQIL